VTPSVPGGQLQLIFAENSLFLQLETRLTENRDEEDEAFKRDLKTHLFKKKYLLYTTLRLLALRDF